MEIITNFLATQGVLGIVILMLIPVVIYVVKDNKRLYARIDELQDKRKIDSDGYTSTYVATTKEMIGTQRDALNAINILQKSVETIATALQALINSRNK
jgi:ferric iron reductase protein FhuF